MSAVQALGKPIYVIGKTGSQVFELSRTQNAYYYRDVHGTAPEKWVPFSGAK